METCWPIEKVQAMSRTVTSDRSHLPAVGQIQVPPQESKAEDLSPARVLVGLAAGLDSAPGMEISQWVLVLIGKVSINCLCLC